MRTWLLLSTFALAVPLAACGDDGGGAGGGSGGGGGAGTFGIGGAVRLTVRSVDTSSDPIEGNRPDPGDTFVFVDLTLENGSDTSLSLDPTGFAVKATGGVEYHGSPLTDLIAGGCELDASVSPDGEARCTVAFSAPSGAALESLAYEWEGGRVEADLSVDGAGGGAASTGSSVSTAGTSVGSSVAASSGTSGIPDDVEVFEPCPSSMTPDAEITNEGSMAFSPSAVTIPAGGIVRFAPTGPHNMTSTDNSANWQTTTSAEACIRFNEPGAYPFECTVHPAMTGTITVQ
jgi:plastocyanin